MMAAGELQVVFSDARRELRKKSSDQSTKSPVDWNICEDILGRVQRPKVQVLLVYVVAESNLQKIEKLVF
jgi:hypothetical protein